MSKKRTLGRIAAVSLAGMTAVSSMAILASADLTLNENTTTTGVPTASGSIAVGVWRSYYTTTTHTASISGVKESSISSITYASSTSATTTTSTETVYNDWGTETTEDLVSGGGSGPAKVYYSTSAKLNAVIAELKKVATYQTSKKVGGSTNSTLSGYCTYTGFVGKCYNEGGSLALAAWKNALTNYKTAYNSYYTAVAKYNSTGKAQTYITYSNGVKSTATYEGSDTAPTELKTDSDLIFKEYKYAVESSTSTLSLTALESIYSELSVADDGEVTLGSSGYTIVTSSSSSSSSSTSTTTTYNTYYPSSSTYRTASTVSYLGNNGYWYTSSTAAATYGNGYSGTYKSSNYDSSSGYVYYSADTGYYYTTSTLAAAAGSHYYAITDSTSTSWYPTSSTYRTASTTSYLGSNGYWYTSSTAASTYGGGYTGTTKTSNYSSVSSYDTLYFSASTGNYYTTSSSAGSYSYSVSKSTTSSTDDPYYYYYLMGTTSSSSSTTEEGAPTIYGSTKRSGWTKITSYINARSNTTVSIDMNETYTIPASVLAAAKSNNITLKIYNDNGSRVTIAPGDVDTSSALNVGITYNVKTIKSSLVAAAKKVNSGTVSTAQIQVGEDGSLGGTVTATVKMSTKRAGDTVKAYRLTSAGKLTREATGTVGSDGRVSFKLKNGGTYLLVVIE